MNEAAGLPENNAPASRERLPARAGRLIWQALRIATPIAVVVVPFGYAITGLHGDVVMGLGCGLAVGVGVGLRGGSSGGPRTGILVGSIVGIITALLAGELPWDGFIMLVAPILGLSVGLIDGLGGPALSGYRDIGREALIVSVLLALGFLPVFPFGSAAGLTAILLVPWTVLIAGLLSHSREGWRDARPPRLLVASAVVLQALVLFTTLGEVLPQTRGIPLAVVAWPIAWSIAIPLAGPVVAFVVGRAATTWLKPRLRMYGRLADYLRVMWIPVGGFAVGYLTIIIVFSGFYGMLERFRPGAFADPGTGIVDWLSFAFFTALGQDFITITPVSVAARMLVGVHLILSAGWALVVVRGSDDVHPAEAGPDRSVDGGPKRRMRGKAGVRMITSPSPRRGCRPCPAN